MAGGVAMTGAAMTGVAMIGIALTNTGAALVVVVMMGQQELKDYSVGFDHVECRV
ncbi:hypothetical protein BD770DRAFT_447203 [Pilaira anomala]|nr:hypothetical protein BD770DRAFT_447203 [Pilaira anomala]